MGQKYAGSGQERAHLQCFTTPCSTSPSTPSCYGTDIRVLHDKWNELGSPHFCLHGLGDVKGGGGAVIREDNLNLCLRICHLNPVKSLFFPAG